MKILYFFQFLWVILSLLDPDPDPATQIKCGSPTLLCCAGWYGAMCQGQAISVLCRAFHVSKDPKYLKAARAAVQVFQKSSKVPYLYVPVFRRLAFLFKNECYGSGMILLEIPFRLAWKLGPGSGSDLEQYQIWIGFPQYTVHSDPGSGAFLTPGSGINIPDPQHWFRKYLLRYFRRNC